MELQAQLFEIIKQKHNTFIRVNSGTRIQNNYKIQNAKKKSFF